MRVSEMWILCLTTTIILNCLSGVDKVDASGKVPITTISDEARQLYLKGRELQDNLRFQESHQYLERAIEIDANFALAHLALSAGQPTAQGFFDCFNRAKDLVDKISEGERLMILGFEAGVNAFPLKQRKYYSQLVHNFPGDERAHNLLAGNYFGQQDYSKAVTVYEKAVAVNPAFPQPYNQLGYAFRFLGEYEKAEATFEKYVELIPDDPNPYDSFAELLLKMGKFDESIELYRKALSVNPKFVASHIGIATNLNLLGRHEDARAQAQRLFEMARNDGERRAALFAKVVSYVDEGQIGDALAELKKRYVFAEANSDIPSLAADLGLMGLLLQEDGKNVEALEKFEDSVKLIRGSDLSDEVIDNAERAYVSNLVRIALAREDLATAREKAEEYRSRAETIDNPIQIRLAHELAGQIALQEGSFDKAIEELRQANQQNPYNSYRIALAYLGAGDKKQAKEWCRNAAEFNSLNNLNYAFIREKAKKMYASL